MSERENELLKLAADPPDGGGGTKSALGAGADPDAPEEEAAADPPDGGGGTES